MESLALLPIHMILKPSKSDHEGLGIAHAYTILDISDKTQQRPQDESALPTNVTLTLRDPRTKS